MVLTPMLKCLSMEASWVKDSSHTVSVWMIEIRTFRVENVLKYR